MLLKNNNPYLDKLRIIQLIETDFNGIIKILINRRLMRHTDSQRTNSNQTYGGRQGHITYDDMIISQLSTDITCLNRSNLLIIFNNADECYDRMCPQLYFLVLRRMSCPKSVVSCYTRTLAHLVHKILTAHAVSTQSITLKFGGSCQGSAGSGASWHCYMEPLLDALSHYSPGCQFTDVTITIHFLLYLIGYIDDNSILCTPVIDLRQTATNVFQCWQTLLHHTGGDLSLTKCVFTMVTWIATSNGELHMTSIKDTPVDLIIQDTPLYAVCISRVEPSHAEHIIQVQMAATTQISTEFNYRLG